MTDTRDDTTFHGAHHDQPTFSPHGTSRAWGRDCIAVAGGNGADYVVGRDPWRPKFEGVEALLAEIAKFEAGEPVAPPSKAEFDAVLREHGPLAHARLFQYHGLGSGDYVKDREAWRPEFETTAELLAAVAEWKVSQKPATG